MTPEQQLREAWQHHADSGDERLLLAVVGRLLAPIPDAAILDSLALFAIERYRAWLIGGEKPQ